jgi:BirA family transcriptional regulator, biotin operon repressor / biotin---[acetyl-CoA-carboxylase] ligase
VSDLDAAAIAIAIAASGGAPRPIVVAASTMSTNDDAKGAAATGAPDGAAFLAETQTAGRGRGGHTWHSPPAENLYLSLVVRPRVPAASLAPITLAVGVAVADVLAARVGERAAVAVKWPNDVLADGRKLAGVLVEGQLRGGEVSSLIVGLGVNVHATEFPPELAARATSLAILGVAHRDRSALAAELILAIEAAVRRFETHRLAGFVEAVARRDALLGQAVEIAGVRGIAAGIDAEGRLLVRGAGGEVTAVVSGEVILDDSACAAGASRGKLSPPP